jgi:hypothetical protein
MVPTSVPTKMAPGEHNADNLNFGDAVGSSEGLIVILVPLCSLLFCAACGVSVYYLIFMHRSMPVHTGEKEGEDGLTIYEKYYVGHRQYSESELMRSSKDNDSGDVSGVELGQVRSLDGVVLSPMQPQQQLSGSESPSPNDIYDRRQHPGIDILYEDKSDDNSTYSVILLVSFLLSFVMCLCHSLIHLLLPACIL